MSFSPYGINRGMFSVDEKGYVLFILDEQIFEWLLGAKAMMMIKMKYP